MFDENEIEKLCLRELTFLKGQRLQVSGAVGALREEEAEVSGTIYIEGNVAANPRRKDAGDKENSQKTVVSENSFYVWVRYNKSEDVIEDYACECAEFQESPGMCAHCAAVALAYLEKSRSRARMHAYRGMLSEARRVRSDREMVGIIQDYVMRKRMREQEADGEIELIPTLHETGWNYYFGRKSYALTFQIGTVKGRKYVLKSLTDFVRAVETETAYTYGKRLSFVHSKSAFSAQGWEYVRLILAAEEMCSEHSDRADKELQLNLATMERFLSLNIGKKIQYDCIGYRYDTLRIVDGNPPVRLCLTQEQGGYRIAIPPLSIWKGEAYLFVRVEDEIYRCTKDYRSAMECILECASPEKEALYRIAPEDMRAFCAAVLPELESQRAVDAGAAELEAYRPGKAEIRYYLDEEDGRVTLKAECAYGAALFNLLEREEPCTALGARPEARALQENGWIPAGEGQTPFGGGGADGSGQKSVRRKIREGYRDVDRERRALAAARAYFPRTDAKAGVLCFASSEHDLMYRLLDTGISQLEREGKVYATDRIRAHSVIRSPRTQVGISLESGLLELSVSSDVFSPGELEEILESYRKRKKYHRLRSGDFLELEHNSVAAVAELLDGLGLSKKELQKETIVLPGYRACFVDASLREADGALEVSRDARCQALLRELGEAEACDYRVPGALAGTLREYQRTGYRWLRLMAQLGFGGILADEMGLGKTLQTIAYLLARKEEGISRRPGLIVCPASLVYNWKRELERFAPALDVRLIAGGAASREAFLEAARQWQGVTGKEQSGLRTGCEREEAAAKEVAQQCLPSDGEAAQVMFGDVWVTSYDLLKRDIALYEGLEFDTEIIDEAQNIKNQGTQAARSVKKICAASRFALTGTPIENRLGELWSIFDYLMPGMLGTYQSFRAAYEQPIVQDGDGRATARLRRLVAPFILRRLKQEVLKELPEKLEQIVYAQMEEEQRRLYEAHAVQLAGQIAAKSSEELSREQLQLLAGLTRLRQICCDPSLLYEDYAAGACKVETCVELVREAVWGRHKVLIFSQFTSMFPILRRRFEEEGIACYELTGETPKKERQRLTEAFNADDVPVFLISLKAGGTGLNLTAASIVIHFDPWWNLAAQNQATDRAHRIGQRSQVVVFKLIAQDTIEEKIVGLQEKKQELAGRLLSGDTVPITALSKEELLAILGS